MVKVMGIKYFNNSKVKILSLLILFSIPIILFILPPTYFDNGQTVCLSVLFFDLECYGCGMTRAVMHFIHFEFIKAIDYNPLVILVFPLLFLLWLKMVFFVFGKKILKWF
jgi:hypothetical protein